MAEVLNGIFAFFLPDTRAEKPLANATGDLCETDTVAKAREWTTAYASKLNIPAECSPLPAQVMASLGKRKADEIGGDSVVAPRQLVKARIAVAAPTVPVGLKGLRNSGNSCYYNSVIQCLVRLPVMREFAQASQPDDSRPFTLALRKLITSMWDATCTEVTSEDLRVCIVAKYLLGSNQHQDAQEMLWCLFNSLQDEEDQRLQNKQPNFARINFYSMFWSTVSCRGCSHASTTEDPTFPISVAIPPPETSPITLLACLNNHSARESIEYTCSGPRCRGGGATRQLRIHNVAPVLVIHLKRFSSDAGVIKKRDDHVQFPPTLPSALGKGVPYELCGVVEHTGTVDQGHYVAYVRAEDQRWYKLDDANPPREVSFDGVVARSNAYLLFYVRAGGPDLAAQQATLQPKVPFEAPVLRAATVTPGTMIRTTTATTMAPPPAPTSLGLSSPAERSARLAMAWPLQREEKILCRKLNGVKPAGGYDWQESELRCVIHNRRVAEGSHRYVVLIDVLGAASKAAPHVLKITKPFITSRLPKEISLIALLEAEVRMQAEAHQLAKRWNALKISHKPIRFNPVHVVQLQREPPQVGLLEPFLEGAYVKHNDNAGGVYMPVEGRERETPQAFSHFTFVATKGRGLVCDIQGVGDLFTDPQIHTDPRDEFPVPGNRGLEGMRDFFMTHRCNPLCFAFLKKLDAEARPLP